MTSDMQVTAGVSAQRTLSELVQRKDHSFQKIRSLYDAEFFALMRRVADIVFEYAVIQRSSGGIFQGDFQMEDLRNLSQGNPFYRQTADGLFLELCYGTPSKLWTPWGLWEFSTVCTGSWDAILPAFLERFGATLYQPIWTDSMIKYGPVYSLHRVDEAILPDPVEMDPRHYVGFRSEIDRSWLELSLRYNGY